MFSPKFLRSLKAVVFRYWKYTQETFSATEIIVPNRSIVFLACCV